MLAPPDAALARREPGLPGLPILLDAEAFASVLRTALPEADVGAARVEYVRFKPGTSCLAVYRVAAGETEATVYAVAYRPDARDKLEKSGKRMSVRGALGLGGVVLEDIATTVYVHPNDRDLGILARLADESGRRYLLTNLFPARPDLWQADLCGLRYRPGRRFVARLAAKRGDGALLKAYAAADDCRIANRNARAFASRGPLRIARRLGHSDRHHLLALEWLPGRPLNEVIRDPEFDVSALYAVGQALAELHAQNHRKVTPIAAEAQRTSLLDAASTVGALCPDLGRRASTLATRLAGDLASLSRLGGSIHGDFSASQVVLTGDRVGIIDLDKASRGDPAVDIGSFAADLELAALRGAVAQERAHAMAGELLNGYRGARREALRPLGQYIAASLLCRASRPFRYREPDWSERTAAIVERAEEIARHG